MKPLRRLVAEAQAEHRDSGKAWALELERLKAQQDALKSELKKSYKGKVVEIGAVKGARGESDRILEDIRTRVPRFVGRVGDLLTVQDRKSVNLLQDVSHVDSRRRSAAFNDFAAVGS